MKSFRLGGIHPHDSKLSASNAIEDYNTPTSVTISLSQHIGQPSVPVVEKGQRVRVGELLASSSGFVSANIYSSVSGVVRSVGAVLDGGGIERMAVVVDIEGDEWLDSIDRSNELIRECNMSPAEIVERVAQSGIVGMGGATFPTHIKLTPPSGKSAKVLIVNGVECEPYLTSDHRVMLEYADEVLVACSIVAKALGVDRCVIGVENNKKDAIKHLRDRINALGYGSLIKVEALKMRYPQGGEKQLVAAIMGVEIQSGQLPIEVGAVVQNVSTMYAIYQAVQKNRPLIDRIVTVTGKDVEKPSNLRVRIGTSVSELVEHCSAGLLDHADDELVKVINGGPMMGKAMSNTESTITKGTSGILIIKGKKATRRTQSPCISCAKCVGACPMGLAPYLLSRLVSHGHYDRLEEHKVTDCIECGCCSYTCPSNIPLLDYIRLGKSETMKLIRMRKK